MPSRISCRSFVTVFAMCSFCISANTVAQSESQAMTKNPMAEANELFADQEWIEAAEAYRAVTRDNPENGQAWFRLGYALHAARKLDEAIVAHKKAAEFAGARATALYNLACAYGLKSEKEHALDALGKAIEAGFNNAQVLASDSDLEIVRDEAKFKKLLAGLRGDSPDPFRQLDFWVGDWDAINAKGKKVGTNRIEKLENGFLILENWRSVRGGTGKSMNYYDREAKKWRQVWISSGGNVTTFEGEFRDGAMRLEGVSVKRDGSLELARIKAGERRGPRFRNGVVSTLPASTARPDE